MKLQRPRRRRSASVQPLVPPIEEEEGALANHAENTVHVDGEQNSSASQDSRAVAPPSIAVAVPPRKSESCAEGKTFGQQKHINLLKHADVPHNVSVAVCYIEDALAGRLAHGRAALFDQPAWKQRCFLIQTHKLWLYTFYFASLIHAALAFWEPPSASRYDLWTYFIEAACLMMYSADTVLKASYTGWRDYVGKKWYRVQMVIASALLLDFLLHCASSDMFRFARPLRLAMLMVKHRDLKRVLDITLSLMRQLLVMYLVLAAFTGMFAAAGVHLYADIYHRPQPAEGQQNHKAFDNVGIALLQLFMLFTTENYPLLIQPAFAASPTNFIFFLFFIYIGVFFISSIILALIVQKYLSLSEHMVKKEESKEWKAILKAFRCLDTDDDGYLQFDEWRDFFAVLRPDATPGQVKFFFQLLDQEQKGSIDPLDMLNLREVLHLRLRPCRVTGSAAKEAEQLFASTRLVVGCRWLLYSCWFDSFIHLLLLVNVVLALLVWRNMSRQLVTALVYTHAAIASVFVAEQLIRILAKGYHDFFSRMSHRIDLCVVLMAWSCLIAAAVMPVSLHGLSLAANLLLSTRLTWLSATARRGLVMATRVVPAMFHMTLFILVFMYFFGIIAMEAFKDVVLEPQDKYFEAYNCDNGYITVGCSLFALTQVLLRNNWNDVLFSLVSGIGYQAAAFFVVFFVVVSLTLMDLFVAVTIETFMSARRSIRGLEIDDFKAALLEIPKQFDDDAEDSSKSSVPDQPHGNGAENGEGKPGALPCPVSSVPSNGAALPQGEDARSPRPQHTGHSQGSDSLAKAASDNATGQSPVACPHVKTATASIVDAELETSFVSDHVVDITPLGESDSGHQIDGETTPSASVIHRRIVRSQSEPLTGIAGDCMPDAPTSQQPNLRRTLSFSSIAGTVSRLIRNRWSSMSAANIRDQNVVYKVERIPGSWRREITGNQDLLASVDEEDVRKLDPKSERLISLLVEKTEMRAELARKASLDRMVGRRRVRELTHQEQLYNISPVLFWWTASHQTDEAGSDSDEEDASVHSVEENQSETVSFDGHDKGLDKDNQQQAHHHTEQGFVEEEHLFTTSRRKHSGDQHSVSSLPVAWNAHPRSRRASAVAGTSQSNVELTKESRGSADLGRILLHSPNSAMNVLAGRISRRKSEAIQLHTLPRVESAKRQHSRRNLASDDDADTSTAGRQWRVPTLRRKSVAHHNHADDFPASMQKSSSKLRRASLGSLGKYPLRNAADGSHQVDVMSKDWNSQSLKSPASNNPALVQGSISLSMASAETEPQSQSQSQVSREQKSAHAPPSIVVSEA